MLLFSCFCCFCYFYNTIIIFADDSIEPIINSSSDVVDSSDFDNVVDTSDPDPKSNTLCFYNTKINKFLYDSDFTFKQYISILNKFPIGILNNYGFAYEHINNLSKN